LVVQVGTLKKDGETIPSWILRRKKRNDIKKQGRSFSVIGKKWGEKNGIKKRARSLNLLGSTKGDRGWKKPKGEHKTERGTAFLKKAEGSPLGET